MQQGIKKLQGFEYLKVVFLEILNAELCRVFANQDTNRKSPVIHIYYIVTSPIKKVTSTKYVPWSAH